MSGAVWRNPRLVLSALLFCGYLLISRAVLHLFPFSIFNMYAGTTTSGSRVVARDTAGRLHEVDQLSAWDCGGRPDVAAGRCSGAPFYSVPYKDAEAVDYIVTHAGHSPAAAPVTLVRRIWRLGRSAADTRVEDCVIQQCTAVPR